MTSAKHTVADDVLGQLARKQWEIQRRIMEGSIDPKQTINSLQAIIEGIDINKPAVATFNGLTLQEVIADWQKFYHEVFGLTVDFSQVSIPDNGSTGLNFLQFMAKELTYRMVHNKEKEMYSDIWDYSDDWPEHIDLDFEAKLYPAKSDYAIWHSGNVEADETYKNKTANWIAKKKIKTMTRLQGGNFGLYMLWKHNTIIDQKVVSLWTASRYTVGDVPCSDWNSDDRRFRSSWRSPDDSGDHLRPRPAVSC